MLWIATTVRLCLLPFPSVTKCLLNFFVNRNFLVINFSMEWIPRTCYIYKFPFYASLPPLFFCFFSMSDFDTIASLVILSCWFLFSFFFLFNCFSLFFWNFKKSANWFSELYLVCHVLFLCRSVRSENECSRGKPFGPCHARVTQKKGITMRHIGPKVITKPPGHMLWVTSWLSF